MSISKIDEAFILAVRDDITVNPLHPGMRSNSLNKCTVTEAVAKAIIVV